MGGLEGRLGMIDPGFWDHRRVFLTGHTGFKGGWLATWLHELGAEVHGYALPPDTTPSFFRLTGLESRVGSTFADVRDREALAHSIREHEPEVVFHLAAQPLVRRSYAEPVETFSTNVLGTVHVLEAVREIGSVRAVVVITSDKCYADDAGPGGHREDDRLGGHDPYSASKAGAELVVEAYRRSFLDGERRAAVASARAGNVVGGGDWSPDRIVPDLVRAVEAGEPLLVRRPDAIRPWQHVLDPLAGYLALGERLHVEGTGWAEAWNFGPDPAADVPVAGLVERILERWGRGSWRPTGSGHEPYEAPVLRLDSAKARRRLGWRPALDLEATVDWTVEWYETARARPSDPDVLLGRTIEQIERWEREARRAGEGAGAR